MKISQCGCVVLLAASVGCFTVPVGSSGLTDFDTTTIVKGQTTRSHLLDRLGDPQQSTVGADGSEQDRWIYRHDTINIGLFGHRTRGPAKSLNATVRDGIVQDYSSTDATPR